MKVYELIALLERMPLLDVVVVEAEEEFLNDPRDVRRITHAETGEEVVVIISHR